MNDAAFDFAQALYDAAEPLDDAPPPLPIAYILECFLDTLDAADKLTDSRQVHRLSDRQATVGIWIDGHEYSLTLNRED